MDLYPAPLSVNKRKSLPAVKLGNNPQKPLLMFGRSTSARVSARSSSGESTVLASNSPPQLTEWPNLDVPKIRRSKSHGRAISKEGSNVAHPKKCSGKSLLTGSTLKDEDRLHSQRAIRTELQKEGKMSQLLHALDKKLIKASARSFSKRLSSNNRSPQIEHPIYSSLKYNFAPPLSTVIMDMHVDDTLSDWKKAEIYVHITITVDVSLEIVQCIPYCLAITAVILLNMT